MDAISCGRPHAVVLTRSASARSFPHGLNNLAVACAAAEIAGKTFADFVLRGFRLTVQ
jgi:hypothetical protein